MFPPGRYIFGLCRSLVERSGTPTVLLEMDPFSETEKDLYLENIGIRIKWSKTMASTSAGRILDCENIRIHLDVSANYEQELVFEGLFSPSEGVIDVYFYQPSESWVTELQALARSEGVIH